MGGLQRHYDMLAFHLASQDCVTEEAYETRANAAKMMPVPQVHQNFEQMQAFALDLMQRNTIGDVLNLCVAGMNNYHIFLAAVKAHKELGQGPEGQQQVNQAQQHFQQAQIDEKFNRLENDYEIRCELEDTIISLGFAIQAMMQHGGIVQQPHVDDSGELGFDLKAVQILGQPDPSQPPQGKLIDHRKVFREGERVHFNRDELQLLLLTAGSFLDELFKSVARYAHENHPNTGQQG